ncbi:glycoside hydrolase family 19 protein [Burkholderia stagnalis]|uniref:glycoside hydrolase family 19 protein n=1 Tax=Burkholderia stagnalis TaxID=1503054 RepID=UPI000F5FF124|nr:glycoside hydrolase family 19 protein [Burkholderia stagnalis]RQZ08889.1 glycoside hydrolase family 19 protein [Burkholderia stagnalis]
MQMTANIIACGCGAAPARAAAMLVPIQAACDRFSISATPARLAAFLPQIGHESAALTQFAESFNYSVAGLRATFRRMTPQLAATLGRQPGAPALPLANQQKIANIVYANQMGNGDAASGDGWSYRGSGMLQLTFHDNFEAFGAACGVDAVGNPDAVRNDPGVAALAAAWFWFANGCNTLADAGAFDSITRRINQAMEGADARRALYKAARAALCIS